MKSTGNTQAQTAKLNQLQLQLSQQKQDLLQKMNSDVKVRQYVVLAIHSHKSVTE